MKRAIHFINPRKSGVIKPRKVEKDTLPDDWTRPTIRAQCPDVRPCPFVGCRYHLYIDVDEDGQIKYNFPHMEPWELHHSCALDIAEKSSEMNSQIDIARITGISKNIIKKIEDSAIEKLTSRGQEILEYLQNATNNSPV